MFTTFVWSILLLVILMVGKWWSKKAESIELHISVAGIEDLSMKSINLHIALGVGIAIAKYGSLIALFYSINKIT